MSKLLLILLLSLLMPSSRQTRTYEPEDEDQDFDNSQEAEGDSEDAHQEDDTEDHQEEAAPDSGSRRDLYIEDDKDDEQDYEEEEYTSKRPTLRNATLAVRFTRKHKPGLMQRPTKSTLQCYSCTYSMGQSLRACLDPRKYHVGVIRCHSSDDRCYTSVQGEAADRMRMLVRGCRSNCLSSSLWSCCANNKCNDAPYSVPVPPEPTESTGRSARAVSRELRLTGAAAAGDAHPPAPPPPAPLLFVGVLLLLQTVLKVMLP